MLNKPIVVNCKKEDYDVYIGRGSKWGNDYIIGVHGTRSEVIELYKKYELPKFSKEEIYELEGKRLGCFCKPEACHGDVLVEAFEQLYKKEKMNELFDEEDNIMNDENKARHIVANQMKLPSGRIIRSWHRHHYNQVEENGEIYFVDGGTEYQRHSGNAEDASIYDDDDFEVIRQYFAWGTRGKGGGQPLKWVILCEMETDHIEAILETQHHLSEWRRNIFQTELDYREKNNE